MELKTIPMVRIPPHVEAHLDPAIWIAWEDTLERYQVAPEDKAMMWRCFVEGWQHGRRCFWVSFSQLLIAMGLLAIFLASIAYSLSYNR